MKLSIIIPAYNEEPALSQIIERCIEAKEHICNCTSLTDVEIIVVNDGSKDNTHQIAKEFKDAGKIKLVSYRKNRGYGAAIKRGFRMASGEYVAFLDADGTCDPKHFANLFNDLEIGNADISIGSRMGPNSQMPKVRRLGNSIYAFLISLISNKKVTDSASGMRIIRKSSLAKIYPLPDGMNFTPAMSAIAVMDDGLKIVEAFMPYKERIGESKLDVVKDGYRFLKTIFEIGLFYKPLKLFFFGAFVLFGVCLFYGIPLLLFYLQTRRVLETDIYRIITIVVLGILSINIFFVGITADEIISIFSNKPVLYNKIKNRLIKSILMPRNILVLGCLLILLGILLNHKTIVEYFLFRTIHVHWTYVITGGFLVLVGAELIVGAFLQKLLMMYKEVLQFRKNQYEHTKPI